MTRAASTPDQLRRRPSVPIDSSIIVRIKGLMVSRGVNGKALTQKDVVARARARGGTIGKATLNRVLGGKVEPKYDTLRAIALGLDVSLAELMPSPTDVPHFQDSDVLAYTLVARGESGLMVAHGNSLEPEVSDGDLVLVERASVLDPGTLVAIRRTGDQVRFMRAYPESGGRFMFQTDVDYIYGDRSLIIGRVAMVFHRPPARARLDVESGSRGRALVVSSR